MSTLGTNSIRVYHVSPYADHSGCMSVFASLGIYVWLDLDTFNTTIEQDSPTWTAPQFYAFTQVLDAFIDFDNLAGFWIGNEVISTAAGSPAAPYIKAAVRDIKSYISVKNYRAIPIGYSAADIASLRPALQNYLACSPNPTENIDFFGLNSYEWCGDSSYTTSGYADLEAMSANYSIPIFFSETGCNVVEPRTFADQGAIFGPNMSATWSGAIVYEWVQAVNDYGLVSYPDDGGGGGSGYPTPIQPDFSNLAGQWKTLSPSGVVEARYTPSLGPPACPGAAGGWLVDGDVALPTLGEAVVSAVAASSFSVVVSTWTSFPTLSGTAAMGTGAGSVGTAAAQTSATAVASATGGNSKAQNGAGVVGPSIRGVGVMVLNIVVVAIL
jgi:1,3-beta-glucanosyltransferase GAS1